MRDSVTIGGAALLAALALVCGGCGAQAHPRLAAPGVALQRFAAAYRAGDYAKACAFAVAHPGFPHNMESAFRPLGGAATPPGIVRRLETANRKGCAQLLRAYAASHLLSLTFGIEGIDAITIAGRVARVCATQAFPSRAGDYPPNTRFFLAEYPVVWPVVFEHGRWLVRTVNASGYCKDTSR